MQEYIYEKLYVTKKNLFIFLQNLTDSTPKLVQSLCNSNAVDAKNVKTTDFGVIKQTVTGKLPVKIPLLDHVYHNVFALDEKFAADNFEPQISVSHKFAPILELILNPPFQISTTSEFSNIVILDLLIRAPFELILVDIQDWTMARNDKISTNLNFGSSCTASSSTSSSGGSNQSSAKSTNDSAGSSKKTSSNYNASLAKTNISLSAVDNEAEACINNTNLSARPDFAVFVNKFLMLVGEEKCLESKKSFADDQLRKVLGKTGSLPWSIFGKVPFLFAYTACGNSVELLCVRHADKELCLLGKYDLSKALHRIKLFINMINVARVLWTYNYIFDQWPYRDLVFFKGTRRALGSFVIIYTSGVLKCYDQLLQDVFTFEDAERIYSFYMICI
jgi:hypothetical protein